ncbi:MAG: hypothetical protein ACRC50_05395 [Gaiella sp.]
MAHLVQFIDVQMSPGQTAAFLARASRDDGSGEIDRAVGSWRGRYELELVARRRSAVAPGLTELQLERRPCGGTHVVYRERELGVVGLSIALIRFAAASLRETVQPLGARRAFPGSPRARDHP